MIWRWFWREWRSPSLLIVWLALSLAMACVLGLGNISDRLEQALNRQSRDVLAGDRVLRSAHPIDKNWLLTAYDMGLRVSEQLSFMTMAYAGSVPILASVKATDKWYPLYGQLKTQPQDSKPTPGSVLVSTRLLDLLKVKVGDNLEIGDADLLIRGELLQEPDAGFNPFDTSPRIIIHLDDVGKTGAVQPGSRLTYRYMFSGSDLEIEKFSSYIKPLLQADQRWVGFEGGTGTIAKSLRRAQQFLTLSALLTLLLSSAAVIVAMQHYCRCRYNLIAVLKTLGAGVASIRQLIVGQWICILLLSVMMGGGLGIIFEHVLLVALGSGLPDPLPEARVWPWLWSLGSLILISFVVGLRPYKQLLATLPIRVLRKDRITTVWPLKYYLPFFLLPLIGVIAYLLDFNTVLWFVLLGIILLVLLLGVIGWGTLWFLRRQILASLATRLAVNRLLHQPAVTASQLGAFSFSFMLLALLFMLRGGLLERWQEQLPAESPNYFILNINDQQVTEVKQFLRQHQLTESLFYPVVRVRLTAINQQVVKDIITEDQPGAEAVNRELNLTWLAKLPATNKMVSGHWPPAKDEVSMEQGIAERLGVKLGDSLTFVGDTQEFSAIVSSLRHVDWESLQPNFYFIFPPKALDDQPQTWLTSFRHEGDSKILTQLNRQFPTLSLLDVSSIIRQASQILSQVSRALTLMVGLVLVCGFLLLFAQIQVGMQQRRQELIVYRTLGASRSLLRKTLWSEFALLGAIAGLTAAVGADTVLWLLQWKLFDIRWQPSVIIWLALPLVSASLLSLCGGWLGLRLFNGQNLYQQYQE